MLKKEIIRINSRMRMSTMPKILMRVMTATGTHMHLNSASHSLRALPRTAKREISHTRTPRTGATSCILRKEREQKASKEVTLFCSQKEEKEVPRVKANPKEKAKESRVKARVIARAKDQKERTHPA